MKQLFLLACVFILPSYSLFAQETVQRDGPQKGAINVEFTAGINNTTPLGIDAKSLRNKISSLESLVLSSYEGGLYPKTAAYVGLLLDYQFHEVGAFGFGLLYTPKGLWLFEKNVPNLLTVIERRKTFITVDYFDIPIFYKEYLKNGKISIRFGPVISMALLSKVRIINELDGDKSKTQYRLGEGDNELVYYAELPNERPKFIVPGFEAALNFGDIGGLQGTLVFGFSGSMYNSVDVKSFIGRLGVSYTFSK